MILYLSPLVLKVPSVSLTHGREVVQSTRESMYHRSKKRNCWNDEVEINHVERVLLSDIRGGR
jgi:hypothetical protein